MSKPTCDIYLLIVTERFIFYSFQCIACITVMIVITSIILTICAKLLHLRLILL